MNQTESIQYLGVKIDSTLNWACYMGNVGSGLRYSSITASYLSPGSLKKHTQDILDHFSCAKCVIEIILFSFFRYLNQLVFSQSINFDANFFAS